MRQPLQLKNSQRYDYSVGKPKTEVEKQSTVKTNHLSFITYHPSLIKYRHMKILNITLILLFISSFTIKAHEYRNLLQSKGTINELKQSLLPTKDWVPFPDYNNREEWQKIFGKNSKDIINKGIKLLNYKWKVVTAGNYLEFDISGKRDVMEKPFNANMTTLNNLILAELAEGKGRFMKKIADGIWYFCEITSWVASAHVNVAQKENTALPSFENDIIDLISGDVGGSLSWTYYFLHEELDKIQPLISKRLYYNLQKRIIKPYMERNDFWWQAFNNSPNQLVNNWNPWCNTNVLTCILLLEKDKNKLAKGVYRTIISVDQFINYVKKDGACEEGPTYWGHASGKLLDYLNLLSLATNKKFNIFDNAMIKNMGEYIANSYIGNGWVVNFADASARKSNSSVTGVIYRYGDAIESNNLKQFAAYLNNKSEKYIYDAKRDLFRTLENLKYEEKIKNTKPATIKKEFIWYPETEFCYMRKKDIFLAVKGGYNNESHNHNDMGSFLFYVNNTPIIIDVGVGTYTKKTFSSQRYSIWTMQSNYHNLPIINGFAQKFGSKYKSNNLTTNEKAKNFKLDLSKAYPNEAQINYWNRNYSLKSNNKLMITDSFSFKKALNKNQLNFMTWAEPKIINKNKIQLKKNNSTVIINFDSNKFTPSIKTIKLEDIRLSKEQEIILFLNIKTNKMNITNLITKGTLLLFIVALISCSQQKKEDNSKVLPTIRVSQLDKAIKPGNNFYYYANKKWMEKNPIPADKSRFGKFDILNEKNKIKIQTIFDSTTKGKNKKGSIAQKIGDFYNSGMNTVAIEKEGIEALKPFLELINKIKTTKDVAYAIGEMRLYGMTPFFYYYSSPDNKNSSINIACLHQSGLGLPDRDYFLEDNDNIKTIQKAYNKYLTILFSLAGYKNAEEITKQVFDFEKKLADFSYTRLQNRDSYLTYNKMSFSDFTKKYNSFDWNNYFKGLSVSEPNEINVNQVAYIDKTCKLIKSESLNVIKNYLTAVTLRSFASSLPKKYEKANFELFGKTIQGKNEPEKRWKKIQSVVSSSLSEGVGELFVKKYFPPKAKAKMEKLVANLRKSLANRIQNLDWMSNKTKSKAIDKLDAITVKIGYPDKWRNYDDLSIIPNSFLKNILATNKFSTLYSLNKIGKPVDKSEWQMSPQTVNAYYNPLANEIVFPAAILQPPFFYLDGDDAVNYGGIGVVIGHEITHGFDDQGALYNKDGNLEMWWTKEDSIKFSKRTQTLVNQYNNFIVLDTIHANGKLTLGENIADLGGINISYDAYIKAIGDSVVPKINGLSDKERFVISFANIWAQNIRDKEILRLTKIDVHSLGKFRVNGVLPNFDAFYTIFNVTENDKMYIEPDKRARIW